MNGSGNPRRNALETVVPIALFGILWGDLIRQLSYQWETNEQYAYGWFVPLFALVLFWKRWGTRPPPQPVNPPRWFALLVVLLAALLLPIRVVYEINPDWALLSWAAALPVVALSLYALFRAGGGTWMRYFAFPVFFMLTAVPWPYRIEHPLTQGLMQVVARLTVETLGWAGVPALQHGNLIEVSKGVVGVNEACSGIRSFQSSFMAALFLGELYWLTFRKRLLLVTGGVILALLFNWARTFILAWHADSAGLDALHEWHDPAGMTILVVCFSCLWMSALWLRRNDKTVPPEVGRMDAPAAVLPARFLIIAGCWGCLVLGATGLWYRAHDVNAPGGFQWSVRFPTNNPTFAKIELSDMTINMLGYDSGDTGRWRESGDGAEWNAFFFRWNPTSVRSIMRARLHRPDTCLQAAGLRQVADGGVEYFEARGLRLPFRKYTFESGDTLYHVFYCLWEDGSESQKGLTYDKHAVRLESALEGRRHLGQQSLEIIATGYASLDEASRGLQNLLPAILKADDPGGASFAAVHGEK